MSTTIDQRIVEMRFDNKNFENNVANTMSTLDKLKQKLNLTGASRGIEEVNTAAKRVDMSYLANGVEAVSAKFSALQVMGITALTNITNQAVNSGKRIASALTIDPIKSGFSEYETQINSVQTILANTESKGTTLNDVNTALDTLNTYADKTIYNFTEMTRNIGTFTAAGVDLDTSVNAIQGIANLAAVSGSSSQQASTAMYQLSQALASGTVKLMDWNSVVNAGMGGQVFQDALKETARVHGVAIDDLIKKQGSFRETLQEGWLTSEILTETLSKFTMTTEGLTDAQIEQNRQALKSKGYTDEQIESIFKLGETATDAATKVKTATQLWDTLKESAQSGWTQTWETIVGDFGEAKELWTGVSEAIGSMISNSADARNNLLSGSLDSNWKKMIGTINEAGIETNKFEEKLRSTLESHGHNVDALIEEHGSLEKVFKNGAVSSDILKEAVDSLGGSMVDLSIIERELKNGLTGDDVKRAQEALQNLGHDLGAAGADGIFGSKTEAAVKAFQELNGLEITGIIDDKTLAALEEANKSASGLKGSCDELISSITELGGREKIIESLKNIFEGFMNIAKPIKEAFREIFPPTTVEQVTNVIDKFQELSVRFKEFTASHGDQIKATFRGIFSVLDIGVTFVKDLAGGLVTLLSKFTGLGGTLLDNTASIGEWLSKLRDSVKEGDFFGKSIDKIVDFLSKGIDKLKEFATSVKDSFKAPGYDGLFGFLKATWEFIKKIGSGIAKAFGSVGQIIADAFGDNTFGDVIDSGVFAAFMVGLYKLINNLNSPFDALADGLEHITGKDGIFDNVKGILDDVRGCFKAYQDQLQAGTLLKIAGAIGILAAAIFVISTIDPETLGKSLAAITMLFGELLGSLTIFTKIGGNLKGVMKAVPLMISLAASLLILSVALKIMSTMSLSEMGVALLGLTVSMGVLVGAVNLLPKNNLTKAAKAIKTMATSLLILSVALKIMATMSWEELLRGLVGTVVGLGALVGAVNLLPKNMGARTAGMIGLATSLVIMAGALKIMATMSWEDIGKGLTTLAGSLLAITLAMKFMPKNMLVIGAGLIGVATALVIIAGAIKIMATMSWEEIGKGLVVLGGALLELAIGLNLMRGTLGGSAALLVASVALAIITPVLLALGGMSWGSIVKGLVALAGAFAVIGVAGYLLTPIIPTLLGLAGAFALFGIATLGIGAGLTLIGVGITAIAPALSVGAASIVASISVIILGILDLIPNMALKFGDIIIAFCKVIVDCAPQIADTLLKLVSEVLKSLATYIPQIADSLFELLIGILNVVAERLPELVTAAVKVIGAFFQGVVDALSGLDTTSLLQGVLAVGLLAGLMFALSAVAGLVPGAMAGVLGIGVVIAELTLVLAAIGALAQIPGLSWIVEEGGDFLQTLGTAIGKFIGGLAGGIAQGFTSALPQIGTDLSEFMTNLQPFIDGAKTIDASVMEGVKALAGVVLAITAADVISGLTSWLTGGSSLTDFGAELAEFGPYMKQYADSIAGIDAQTVVASAIAAKALTEMCASIPNSGGVAAWFAGENSISKFASELLALGLGLKGYSIAIAGINTEAIIASTTGAKALADLCNHIPNTGGVAAWFAGENSISKFAGELPLLGVGLKGFSDSITGIVPENIIAAANAAKALAQMVNVIPNEGGIKAWFTGDASVSKFAEHLPALGKGLKGFSDSIAGIVPENITTAAKAATELAKMASATPVDTYNLISFGENLTVFGTKLRSYFNSVGTITAESTSNVRRVIDSINSTANMDASGIKSAASAINSLISALQKMPAITESTVSGFSNAMTKLSGTSVNTLVASFNAATPRITAIGGQIVTTLSNGITAKQGLMTSTSIALINRTVTVFNSKVGLFRESATRLMNAFVQGILGSAPKVSSAATVSLSGAISSINGYYDSFYSAGSYLVDGFAAGISANSYKASAQAAAMAAAAYTAAKEELDVNSPSKIFRALGYTVPEGFAMGIDKLSGMASKSADSMANSAIGTVSKSVSRIADAINRDIDAQPTIRPIVDLSGVKAGASSISSMLGFGTSVGLMTNVGAISSMMNGNQNGTNSDVVSAIDKLRKDIGNVGGNTYVIDGITYDDGSNISSAVGELIRAAKIGGRM